ncbi:MAG: HD domain-containing protein [Candidatus Saccharimonadales bacterium]
MKSSAVQQTADFIKEKFGQEASGHDWWHMYRVWQLAKRIAVDEKNVDMEVVELAALLHDIADFKFHDGDFEAGPKAARAWLEKIEVEEPTIAHVEDIVRNISFKGASVAPSLKTLEGKVVHDADKLDAMGAIGITRAFAYCGFSGIPIFLPDRAEALNMTQEEFVKGAISGINHFHEKLLLLKDRMYTKTGKRLAQQRHRYMEKFLQEFEKEWASED